jgi:hypothetical protein
MALKHLLATVDFAPCIVIYHECWTEENLTPSGANPFQSADPILHHEPAPSFKKS